MKKLAAILSAAVTAAAGMPFFCGTESTADDTIKIMCIGDSITDGYVPEYAGSYRKFIYRGLTEKGYSIDMVGSKDGGYIPTYTDNATGESFEFDNENTGYSGYSIKAYPGRNGILETLQQTKCLQEKQPDIVTLQIGTNNIIDNHDMSESCKELGELIEYILDNIPEDSALFVSTIPLMEPNREGVRDWFANYRHSADWQTAYNDIEVEQRVLKATMSYNTDIEDLILNTMRKEHSNVYLSKAGYTLMTGGGNSSFQPISEMLFDGVHPNNVGYKAMGEYWTDLLADYLGGGAPTDTSTTTTVTTTTETITSATETTTTSTMPEHTDIMVNDLVTFSRYLLGDRRVAETYAARLKDYDLDSDGVLDTFDLVLMRKLLVSRSAPVGG